MATKEELKPGQPSRYHKYEWRDGKGRWVLNQQHPAIRPTATCKIDHDHYCAYCGARARPIQPRLGQYKSSYLSYDGYDPEYEKWLYATTGHTCDCAKARLERKFQDESAEFEKKAAERRTKFRMSYLKRLNFDTKKLLAVKHRKEQQRVKGSWSLDGVLEFHDDPRAIHSGD